MMLLRLIDSFKNVENNQLIRIIFFILFPIICSFLLPLIVYKLPIKIRTINGVVELLNTEIIAAILIWVVWISVVLGVSVFLARKFNYYRANELRWSAVTLWRAFLILSIVSSFITLLNYFLSFNASIKQLIVQLLLSPTIAIIIGIKLLQDGFQFNNKKPKFVCVITIIFLVFDFFVAIALPLFLGIAANAVYVGLPIMFAVHAFKVNKKYIILSWLIYILIVLLALGFKNEFRTSGIGSFLWRDGQYTRITVSNFSLDKPYEFFAYATNKDYSFSTNALIFSKYDPNYQGIRFFSEESFLKYPFARCIHRINHLGELAYVIKMTPEKILYLHGATYYPIIFKPIPRVFWKNKPEDSSGQIFGHRYVFLNHLDKTTSVNMPIIVEAWINGGWLVLLITSLLFGTLIYLCWKYFIGESAQVGNVVRASVFIASMVYSESSLNLVIGGAFYTLVVWLPIEWLIRTKL